MKLNLSYIFTVANPCAGGHSHCFNPGPTIQDADIGRYQLMHDHGGVYHDTDAHFVVSPEDWPSRYPHLDWEAADIVVGVEFPNTGQLCQWVFAAAPRSQLLFHAYKTANSNRNRGVADVIQSTGPGMWTGVIMTHIGKPLNIDEIERIGGREYRSNVTGELLLILPYRAFGIHTSHGYKRTPRKEVLVRHDFLGRWRNQ